MTPEVLAALAAQASDSDVAVVRDGRRTILATHPCDARVATGLGSLEELRAIESEGGWWAGWASYDLGRQLEDFAPRLSTDLAVPDLCFVRFARRFVFEPGRLPFVETDQFELPELEDAHRRYPLPARPLEQWSSSLDHAAWARAVDHIHELLRAGDCYQVNLTRRLISEPTDPRALFANLARMNPAPHAALLDLRGASGVAVASASPEQFLARRGNSIETGPIKGTASERAVLSASEKDRAENVMIVDLARNDLGRICEYGSISVPNLCVAQAHPGLHHLVSTVCGRLRSGITLGEIIGATFPAASITGAPKPRVLSIIEELEPVRRGVYCGAAGWIDTDRRSCNLNVAIRTFAVTEDATVFGVGAGIVADSDASAEWDETELKAARCLAAAAGDHSGAARAMLALAR